MIRHIFLLLFPRAWLIFIRKKKVAKSSISLLNVSERTRGSRHFAADSTGWLVVREEKTETSYSAGIYLYVPWRLGPPTALYSAFYSVLFKKQTRAIFFPLLNCLLFTWSARGFSFPNWSPERGVPRSNSISPEKLLTSLARVQLDEHIAI